ncbi:MAG: LysE family transporter [Lacisediminihabitans sp.]
MDFFVALGSGVLAGIGLVAPLGAIGVLLIHEGLASGFTGAAPAAVAVSLIDACYCTLAVVAGAVAAPVIASWGDVPAVAGGLALIGLGLFGVYRTFARATASAEEVAGSVPASKWRRFILFIGLTAINPATLLYFAALTIGLGGTLASLAGSVAFIVGVTIASLTWQLGLVTVGAVFRGRVAAKAQRLLSALGYSIVFFLGVAVIASTMLEVT